VRSLQRNEQTFWYRLFFENVEPLVDEWGNESGEYRTGYLDPVEMRANISPASGASVTEQFGNLDNYDKVIVTTDMSCPIDENSVLYINSEPVKTGDNWSPYDYVVRRVARSLNGLSIAIRKVDVS